MGQDREGRFHSGSVKADWAAFLWYFVRRLLGYEGLDVTRDAFRAVFW